MKKNQSGRSLVEILAVMAIIGVFSLGSIVAFQTGINSVRARYILEQVQLRVSEATSMAELSKGHKKQVYTPEYVNKTSEGTYGYSFTTEDVSIDRNSLQYYVSANRAATVIEVTVHGNITPSVCGSLKGKLTGDIQKLNDVAVEKFVCPTTDLTELKFTVNKKK